MSTHKDLDRYVDPDSWAQITPRREGSWWEAWQRWLVDRSTGLQEPPQMGAAEAGYAPLMEAPGSYVRMQ